MESEKRSIAVVIIIASFGIVLGGILIGIAEQERYYCGYNIIDDVPIPQYCTRTIRPYEGAGILLIFLGIVLFVVAGILYMKRTS